METQEEIYLPVPIEEYKDKYLVSNTGNIKSTVNNKIMKSCDRNGYKSVGLSYESKTKNFMIHRLVAITFLDNPMNFKFVNHKDGYKSNNNVLNLEWCTSSENVIHSQKVLGKVRSTKAVRQLDLNGNIIAEFKSAKEAEEITGISSKHIPSVCKGTRKTTGGCKWEYIIPEEIIEYPIGKILMEYPNYIITSDGRVYSKNINNFLVLNHQKSGYVTVGLSNGVKKDFYVHILVATLYLEPIEGKHKVNHKDRDKSNNNVDNLEWVTESENMFHYHGTENKIETIPVIKYDSKCNIIVKYKNIKEASRENNIDAGSIKKACEGVYKTAGGHIWKYNI